MPPRLPLPRARFFRLESPPQYRPQCRPSSSQPQPQSTTTPKSQLRIEKFLNRTPPFLRPYVSGLRNAPGTHISSFLILHELTAIVPLIIFGVGFHYSGWLPGGLDEEKVLGYMNQFGNYFGKKGWFGVSIEEVVIDGAKAGEMQGSEGEIQHKVLTHQEEDRIIEEQKYGSGTRIVIEVATAYAITKVLLPVRILGSVWATPWFARTVLGAFRKFRR